MSSNKKLLGMQTTKKIWSITTKKKGERGEKNRPQNDKWNNYRRGYWKLLQANLADSVGLDPDHHNKMIIIIKQVTQSFWFPSAYKGYVYATL